ncbi:MAG TPA: hypothetical protein VL947_00990 [Cytophagales bacterium]|nr:hypothetical protein [Cytophagales bacterium]
MRKIILWLLFLCQAALASNHVSEFSKNKKVMVTSKRHELPDSIQRQVVESLVPQDVEKEHKKGEKKIVFTLLRVVFTVVLVVLITVLLMILL